MTGRPHPVIPRPQGVIPRPQVVIPRFNRGIHDNQQAHWAPRLNRGATSGIRAVIPRFNPMRRTGGIHRNLQATWAPRLNRGATSFEGQR